MPSELFLLAAVKSIFFSNTTPIQLNSHHWLFLTSTEITQFYMKRQYFQRKRYLLSNQYLGIYYVIQRVSIQILRFPV